LIVFIDTVCAYVKTKSASKHLSDERRSTKCEKLVEVLLALSVIVRPKIWREHAIHMVYALEGSTV
jgi:hypothetical protein